MAKQDTMSINDVKALAKKESEEVLKPHLNKINAMITELRDEMPAGGLSEKEIKNLIASEINIEKISGEVWKNLNPKLDAKLDEAIEEMDVEISKEDIDEIIKNVSKNLQKSVGELPTKDDVEAIKKGIPTREQVEGVAIAAVNAYMEQVFKATGMDPAAFGGSSGKGFNLMGAASTVMSMIGGGKAPAKPDKNKEIKQEPAELAPAPLKCLACNNENMTGIKPVARTVCDVRVPVIICPDCETENIAAQCPTCGNKLFAPITIKPDEIVECPTCGAKITFFSSPEQT